MSASQFGQMLRQLRHEKGATLSEVAKATGVSIPMLSRMERGERLPSDETLRALAHYYGTSSRVLAEAAAHQHSLNRYADSWLEDAPLDSLASIEPVANRPRAEGHLALLRSLPEGEAGIDWRSPEAAEMYRRPRAAFTARPIGDLFDVGSESSAEAVEDAAVAAEAAVKQLGRELRRSTQYMTPEERERTREEVRKLGDLVSRLDDDRFWRSP